MTDEALEGPLGRCRERSRLVRDLTFALSKKTEPDGATALVISRLCDFLGAATGIAYLITGADELKVSTSEGFDTANRDALASAAVPAPIAKAVNERRALFSTSRAALVETFPNVSETRPVTTNLQACACLPLVVDDRPLGALAFAFTRPHAIDDADKELLFTVADVCAGAVQRSKLLDEAKVKGGILRGVGDVTATLGSAVGIDAVLATVTERARWILGAHRAVTTMLVEGDVAQGRRAVSLSEEYGASVGGDLPPEGLVLQRRLGDVKGPARLTHAQLEAHPRWRGLERRLSPQGWLAAPLIDRHGETVGVVELFDKQQGEFSALDESILVQLAQLASLAIENTLLLEQLRDEHERAERATRAKDEFLAILGHELRNPLAPIRTAAHIMKRHGAAGHDRELETIERQVGSLIRLVDDLLDVSRITRGRIELRRKSTDIGVVVRQALEAVSALLEQRRHRITLVLPERELLVSADEERLVQSLINVLTNAATYTPPAGAVEVIAEEGSSGGRSEVVITVRDNGPGMDAAFIERAFEMFVQEGRGLDRSQGGLGLGLTVARSLIELHGGSIVAQSPEVGGGTTVIMRLPLAPVRRIKNEEPQRHSTAPIAGRARVLIVDDNRDAAQMLARLLALEGFDTRVAEDGPAALVLAATFHPDVAFLDVGLPAMDGYELARQLRRQAERAPLRLVALTGYAQPTDKESARAAGFDEHLAKPLDPAAVCAFVTRLCEKGSSPREG